VSAFAQTNLQLLNQLHARKWPEHELATVGRAYDLASRVFSSQYRASGKPFVAHLVGTASIVATVGERRPVVLAALLHAVYSHGEFGDGRRGETTRTRTVIREVVGADAERLIGMYTRARWDAATVADLTRRAEHLQARDREVAVLLIANDAEDHLDLGMLYCAKQECVALSDDAILAEHLGRASLAAMVRAAEAAEREADVPPGVRAHRSAAYRLAPLSHGLRARARVGAARWHARRMIASLLLVRAVARRRRAAERR
jgi:(p)ppGpp synthase/HD superfamily hydrolase